jgi:sterol desaturase/sphingolipid hydroxylase (fatty acid hydroxylase superfamily)
MDTSAFELLARSQSEQWQYAAFFGALVMLATLEALAPAVASRAERRQRWPANFGLTALNIFVIGAVPLSGLAAADWAAANQWGLLNQPQVPAVAALVAGFLARSLVSYGVHVANHKVPLLWRVHRVHHSDTQFDVSTTVRFHPLEFVYSIPINIAGVVLFGIPPLAFILYEVFDAAMAVWTHANIRLPQRLERAISYVLVTPRMHRIHHSAWQPETDSNYGATFSCWDRLFGTFRAGSPQTDKQIVLGLDEVQDKQSSSFLWLLSMPFRERLASTRNGSARDHATQIDAGKKEPSP